jgi:transposase
MHDRYELTDQQWERISSLFPTNGRRGGQWNDHRTVLNGILWVLCSGAAWRDLPERYGCCKTVHGRLLRWRRDGTWERVLRALRARADSRGLIDWAQWNADSTSVRATRHAAGARRRRPPKKSGRSRPPRTRV